MINKYLFVFLFSWISNLAQSQNIDEQKNTSKTEIISELVDSPTDLVQRQLDAYNERNIESFLELYDNNVEAYLYPTNKIAFKGKEAMKKIYSKIFKETPNLHCELINRITQGNKVIDKERVQFGNDIIEVVAIYFIEKNKITKIHFIN